MAQTNTSQAPLPGYETTYITRPELADDALKTFQTKLNDVIAQHGGEVVLTEDWGRRKLAYPIQKETRGQYTYLVYSGKGDVVAEMERHLRIHEHVLRFLSVNLEKEFNPETFRKQRADYHAAVKRREAEREARREERAAERGEHYHRERAPREAVADVAGSDDMEE